MQNFDEIKAFLSEVSLLPEKPEQTLEIISNILKDYEQEKKVKIAVMGEFSTGKSAFINSIFGRWFLPIGITPTTYALHYIFYGDEESVVIHYRNSKQKKYSLEQYITDSRSVINQIKEENYPIEKVEVFIHHDLSRNFVFIDTPGLEDPMYPNYETLYQILPLTDIIIFILNINKLLSLPEKIFLSEKLYKGDLQKILVIVNQIDLIEDKNEWMSAVKTVKYFLNSINQNIPILYYSAKKNLSMQLENAISNEFGFSDVQFQIKNWKSNHIVLRERYFRQRFGYGVQQLSMYFDTQIQLLQDQGKQLEATEKTLNEAVEFTQEKITFVLKDVKVKIEVFFKQFENEFIHDFSELKFHLKDKMSRIQPEKKKFSHFVNDLTEDNVEEISVWKKVISDIQTELKDIVEKNALVYESQLKALLTESVKKEFPDVSLNPDGLMSEETLNTLFREVGKQKISTGYNKIALATALGGTYLTWTGNIHFGAPLVIGSYFLSNLANEWKHKKEMDILSLELTDIIDRVIDDVKKILIVKRNETFTNFEKDIKEAITISYSDVLQSIMSQKERLKTADFPEIEKKIQTYQLLNQKLQSLLYKIASDSLR